MPKHTVDEHLDHLRRFIVVLKEHHRELAELRKEKRKRRDALKANVDSLAARLIELRRMQDKADKSAPKTLGDFLRVRPPDARLNALYRMFIDLLPAMIRFYDEEVTPKFATFRKTAEAWKAAIATIQEDWRGCEPKDANRWEGLYKAYKALLTAYRTHPFAMQRAKELGQWHASLYGLGDILDPAQVKRANAAIYKYNYIPQMGDVYNPCRIYCLNDEGGLVICAWPEGSQKPTIPAPYSQETMNGFEYSAATHMIMTGLVDEGMECITAIRKRYDGERRNPWNEFECGSNYARSMAAYALLNAFSGFSFDMAEGQIGFQPVRMEKSKFRAFWSLAPGWGDVNIERKKAELRVLKGELPLKTVELPLGKSKVKGVKLGAREVAFQQSGDTVALGEGVTIGAGETLVVNW